MHASRGVVATAVADLTIAERSEAGTERAPAVLYHLIARGNVARYNDAVSLLKSAAVSVSGPWPPFAFAPDLRPKSGPENEPRRAAHRSRALGPADELRPR